MSWPVSADELLLAPRGRRLCWSLLDSLLDGQGHTAWRRVRYRVRHGAYQDDLTGLVPEVSASVAMVDLVSLAESGDELRLLAALVEPVDSAAYWEPPDDVDRALADAAVQRVLLPVAHAVTTAVAARWWPSPVQMERQRYVEWTDEHGCPLAVSGAAGELACWRVDAARRGGAWWSTPRPSGLPATTRALAGLGAVGLGLVEDGSGCDQARCWPVDATRPARVYEITGPGRWVDLVGRYPLDVTRACHDSWQHLADWDGAWLIPDFEALASDYDAIHLTVTGYLVTAGRALPVEGAHTLLAGWDPDETYWLTDVLAVSGSPRTWTLEREPIGWRPNDA